MSRFSGVLRTGVKPLRVFGSGRGECKCIRLHGITLQFPCFGTKLVVNPEISAGYCFDHTGRSSLCTRIEENPSRSHAMPGAGWFRVRVLVHYKEVAQRGSFLGCSNQHLPPRAQYWLAASRYWVQSDAIPR
jgi:hypothetical protein